MRLQKELKLPITLGPFLVEVAVPSRVWKRRPPRFTTAGPTWLFLRRSLLLGVLDSEYHDADCLFAAKLDGTKQANEGSLHDNGCLRLPAPACAGLGNGFALEQMSACLPEEATKSVRLVEFAAL